MAEHNYLGQWGENVAANYLVAKGYSIVERGFKAGRFEIDIVAMDGDEVVFVEVKTRSDSFTDPVEAVDDKKIRHMAKAADMYLRINRIPHSPRFDVIGIVGQPGGEYELTHYPDAFLPPLDAR